MFTRFHQTPRRLQVSLIETRRVDGKVKQEHVASLGSIATEPTAADRLAFWTRLFQTLGRLSNRLDTAAQRTIFDAIHARIPMPAQDEVTAGKLDAMQASIGQWEFIESLHRDGVEEQTFRLKDAQKKLAVHQAELAAASDKANSARDRMRRIEAGENIAADRPMTLKQLAASLGWTAADQRHAERLHEIERIRAKPILLDEMVRRSRANDKIASRAVLRVLRGEV
jgi:hypothetical protein